MTHRYLTFSEDHTIRPLSLMSTLTKKGGMPTMRIRLFPTAQPPSCDHSCKYCKLKCHIQIQCDLCGKFISKKDYDVHRVRFHPFL